MRSDRKAILSVMLIIVVLSMIFLAQTAYSYRRHRNESIQHNIDEARRIIASNLSAVRTLYQAQLAHLTSRHSEILEPFHQRDRQRLYEVALPVFEEMKAQHLDFTNMHFHLPDGRSFLRMHKPSEYGDDLTAVRPMIARMHRDRTGQDGYEFGVHGLFYRVAEPIVHEGRYFGVLEFGVRPDAMIKDVETILGVRIALRASPTQSQGARRDDAVAPPVLRPLLSVEGRESGFLDLAAEEIECATPREIQTSAGRVCVYRAYEIRDFQGDSVGHLLIAQNIGSQTAQYHRLMFTACLVTAGLVAAAYVVLHLSFGQMIQRIVSLNRTLEHRVRERTEELNGEKKKVEATNTELSQIFDTVAGGGRVIDTDFRTIRVNKSFKEMVGVGEAELIGKRCHETFPGPHCHTARCPVRCILNGDERVELDVDKVRKSGRVVPCLLTATPW